MTKLGSTPGGQYRSVFERGTIGATMLRRQYREKV